MANTALVQVRIEPGLKKEVDKILAENGLDAPTAIRMFFAKVRNSNGLPFQARNVCEVCEAAPRYNRTTLRAIKESEKILKHPERYKSYDSAEEMSRDILGDKRYEEIHSQAD
jgi:DNA-damage-inducible protein J